MTIYDVKFYGVYFSYKLEFSGVNIFTSKERVHVVPGFENELFEITVLKEFEGKEDVLKLEFANGEVAYETLNAPYLYKDMEDGIWKLSHDTSTPETFMKAYLMFNEN